MDAQTLFEKLQEETGKNPNDIAVVLDSFIIIILERLNQGQPVEFGEMGQFILSDYGKLSFRLNPEFARVVNYKYETIQPIPIEDHDGQPDTPAGELSATTEDVEISLEEQPGPESVDDLFVDDQADLTLEELPAPVASGTVQVLDADESPFISGPEPVTIEELVTPEEPEPVDFPAIPEPMVSEPAVQEPIAPEPPVIQAPPIFTPPPIPEIPKPPVAAFQPPPVAAPAPTFAAPPAVEPPPVSDRKIDPMEYNLSVADLGKEMDQKKIWTFIALGIAAVVLAIWFFMSGDKKEQAQILASRQDSTATPVQSVPVSADPVADLASRKPGETKPATSPAKPVQQTQQPAAKAPVTEAAKPTPKPAEKQTATKPTPAQPVSKPAEKPAAQPVAAKPAAKPVVKPVASQPADGAPAAGFSTPVSLAAGGFSINIGSFPTQAQADKLLASWKAKGYEGLVQEAFVESLNKTVYRVRLGQFTTRSAAAAALETIKSEVPDAWVDRLK